MLSALSVDRGGRAAHPAGGVRRCADRGDALGALARRIAALAEAPGRAVAGRLAGAVAAQTAAGRCRTTMPINDPAQVLARARDLLLARLEEG